ncbi:MAG: LysR family transcriptional regulator [Paracoccaceae bacterium]
MTDALRSLNWSLIQAFLAVAEEGSLSQAATRLGASQPTLGRHIQQIEQALGVPLFTRQPRGLSLTETGAELLPHAQAMRAAMHQMTLTAAGHQHDLNGPVRVTASHVVALHLLPPIIAKLRAAEPGIVIDLDPSDETGNLLFREADIAVRMYRPTQLELVARHLGDIRLTAFAAHDYLNRRGWPETVQDLRQHDLVGYDRSDLILRAMQQGGIPARRDWFTTRCDDQVTYLELVRAGCGIGFGQAQMIARDPQVAEIPLGVDIPALPVWLTAPQAMRSTPRIRHVWDALASGLAPFVS